MSHLRATSQTFPEEPTSSQALAERRTPHLCAAAGARRFSDALHARARDDSTLRPRGVPVTDAGA